MVDYSTELKLFGGHPTPQTDKSAEAKNILLSYGSTLQWSVCEIIINQCLNLSRIINVRSGFVDGVQERPTNKDNDFSCGYTE